MSAGRPTDYNPDFCELVIELGKQGKSVAQMASECDVSKQTMLTWASIYPEFLDALTLAKTHSQNWWESKGQDNLLSSGGVSLNAGVWSRSMAARFPDDWRENKGVELTGAGGGALKFEEVRRTIVDPKAPE